MSVVDQAFSSLDCDRPDIAPHVRAEAEALEQLAKAKAELEEYRRIFGGPSTDIVRLAEQLRAKDAELEQIKLTAKELEEVRSFQHHRFFGILTNFFRNI